MNRWVCVIVLLASAFAACADGGAERVDLTIVVEDDHGSPVEGVAVRGSFFDQQVRKGKLGGRVAGLTDAAGRVEINGTEDLYVDVSAEREGFYLSTHRVLVRDRALLEAGGEQRIRLRRKIDPIAMRVKRVVLLVKERFAGEPYGYDLMVGDFVAPLGQGVVSDLELSYDREDVGDFEWSWSFSARFANPGDGLIPVIFDPRGSQYRSDFEAPAEGYRREFALSRSRAGMGQPATGRDDPNQGYYFRIRTEVDESGAVVGGYYGKIYGEFPKVAYYLNPQQGSRNVEWDIDRNLFGSLSTMERTREP